MYGIKKLLRNLAISFLIRKAYVEWTALSVMLALGFLEEIVPTIEAGFVSFVTISVIWLYWVRREEVHKIIMEYRHYRKRISLVYIRSREPP